MDFLAEAVRLHTAGLKVIPTSDPTKPDGKRPLCQWKQYQKEQTRQDIQKLFSTNVGGIALLTGNGIEVIDVDLKYALHPTKFELEFFDALFNVLGFDCYDSLILSKTVSGGYHIIYRTNIAEGNQKLASRYTTDKEKKNEHDKTRVLLETRGEGGYILIPITEGYRYDNIQKDVTKLPFLDDFQRNAIINVCKSFDELGEIYKQKASTPIEVTGGNKTTIEAFNEAHTPTEFIEAAGWQHKYTRGNDEYYVRAGKDLREGIGAGYNSEKNLLYVFTSSTQFEPNKAYNAFQTYSYLNHDGDYKAAAKELYHKGYGERITKNRETHTEKLELIIEGNDFAKEQIENTSVMEEIFKSRFDVNVKPVDKPSTLFFYDSFKQDYVGIAGYGDVVVCSGSSGSRKSAVSSMACAANLDGGMNEALMWKADIDDKNVLAIDTEQGGTDYYRTNKEMFYQAQVPNGHNPRNFYSYRLTEYTLEQKVSFLDYAVNKINNLGYVWIDGIVDLCQDYNDLKESKMLVDYMMQIAAKHNFLLFLVLHNARTTGDLRGHLGSFLKNKVKAIINCKKDADLNSTTVSFTKTRGFTPPNNLTVEHDNNGHLYFTK
jgi:hypothetical protein